MSAELDFGGLPGGATSAVKLIKTVTGIADATATAVFTVTVPNGAHAAVIRLTVLASLGAGGAIGAFEASAILDGSVVVARTAGVSAVVTAATAVLTGSAAVAGATTITLTYDVSSVSGAVGVTETFTIRVTITKGGGSSAAHQAVVVGELVNAASSGVTFA